MTVAAAPVPRVTCDQREASGCGYTADDAPSTGTVSLSLKSFGASTGAPDGARASESLE